MRELQVAPGAFIYTVISGSYELLLMYCHHKVHTELPLRDLP